MAGDGSTPEDGLIPLATLPINSTHEVRVTLLTGGHRPTVSIREFRMRDTSDWRPQKQAVYVGAPFLPDLIRALLRAHQIATGQRNG